MTRSFRWLVKLRTTPVEGTERKMFQVWQKKKDSQQTPELVAKANKHFVIFGLGSYERKFFSHFLSVFTC